MTRNLSAVLLSAATAFAAASVAAARPVSYQGGWTLIEATDRQATGLLAHYTVRPNLSVGWRTEWDRRQNFIFNGVQGTYLAKRWFGENFQANLYAIAGAGAVSGVDENDAGSRAAGFVSALADWETRRLFISYRARALEGGVVDASFFHAARFGVAPYIGDTDDIHTWLMVEIDHRPDNNEPIGVTPLVRFLKGGALLEVGWSAIDDQPLANFTYRF